LKYTSIWNKIESSEDRTYHQLGLNLLNYFKSSFKNKLVVH